jgi:glycosyltransferase involved in cell wall biosynthesis
LDTSVVLEPWRDDLPSFLKSFDLFLLPSNFEGYPRVCIEATAAGLPVVMTDVGSAGELFVDGVNAVVVPVGDRRAMRQAVLRLFSSPQERRRLARAAREVVERRPYRSMADYYHAYREAVEACVK